MKRIFILACLISCLFTVSCYDDEIEGLKEKIEALEGTQIASLQKQVTAIKNTLPKLEKTDKDLNTYIKSLQNTASDLQKSISETNDKIEEVKAALQDEITAEKAAIMAHLTTLKTELEAELAKINTTIAALQAKDTELDRKIAELKAYVDTELTNNEDWINATFATLEQYSSLATEIATIKASITALNSSIESLESRMSETISSEITKALEPIKDELVANVISEIADSYLGAIAEAKEEITTAYTAAIETAISGLEASMKSWVSDQLKGYYTIAEVEGKLAALKSNVSENDKAIQTEIEELEKELSETEKEITDAYSKAIEDAIIENNGTIDGKIAQTITQINSRIDNEIADINNKIADIESRLEKMEGDIEDIQQEIANLLKRIQSVTYIPTYDDGKATMKYAGEVSRVTLDFEISPKDAVSELANIWKNAVSLKAIYTQTRAVSFIDMPIVEFEADINNGIISVTASGENLSEDFFNGTQTASVRLAISDGNNSVTSDYVPMIKKEVPVSEIILNNEIWYTATEKVEPRNPGPGYPSLFDANIVSNTYKNGQGIITFDGDVTSIGEAAFYLCRSLTSVTIPESITSIENYAFANCINLTAFYGKFASVDNRCLVVDGALTSFAPAGLTEYTIPDGVTSIGECAFAYCNSLTSVTIPESVTSIEYFAFLFCTSLTSVTIPESITSIENYAFANCISLTAFYGKFASADNRCLVVDGALTSFAPAGLTEYTIPDGVTSIGEGAFADCSSLTSVTIPDGVTSIGIEAFAYCSSLTSVTIGNSVTSIGESAFVGCSSLTSVTIPDGVTSIGSSAFEECSSLTSVTIPDGVTSIEGFAFAYCSSLTSVTIPDGVTWIGYFAFKDCGSLTNITIPESVESFGDRAFSGCSSLTSVYCKPTNPPSGSSDMLSNGTSDRKIYVPFQSVEIYKTANYWKEYAESIVPYDFEKGEVVL